MRRTTLLSLLLTGALPAQTAFHMPGWFEPSGEAAVGGGAGLGLFISRYGVDSAAGGIRFAGTEARNGIRLEQPLRARSQYFIGSDPLRWRENVPQYGRVRQSSIYPGVDLVYYFDRGRLEFDLELSEGADPDRIRLEFSTQVELERGNELMAGDLRVGAPAAYQGDRKSVV